METIVVAAVLVPIAGAVIAIEAFDDLLETQHARYRRAWEAAGRPRGFFWAPPGLEEPAGAAALPRVLMAWLIATPTWARQAADLRRPLWRLRAGAMVWNITVLAAATAWLLGWI